MATQIHTFLKKNTLAAERCPDEKKRDGFVSYGRFESSAAMAAERGVETTFACFDELHGSMEVRCLVFAVLI